MASTEVERVGGHVNGVDVADVPSAAWGWSKVNHFNWRVTGFVIALLLLAFLRGNQVGHTGDAYCVGFAVLALFFVVRDWWGRRRGWLR